MPDKKRTVSIAVAEIADTDEAKKPRKSITKKNSMDSFAPEARILSSFFLKELDTKIQTSYLYPDFVVYLVFLAMFTVFCLWGRNIGESYYAVKSLKELVINPEFPNMEIEKFYDGIALPGDWNDWFTGVVLPALWDSSQPDESIPVRYAWGENIMLGALRTRMLRVRDDSCMINRVIYDTSPGISQVCRGVWSAENEYKQPYKSWNWTDPELQYMGTTTTGDIEAYHAGGFVETFKFASPYNTVAKRAKHLVDSTWVDSLATRFVIVEFFLYIPQFDQFQSVKVFNEVTAGGAWVPNTQFRIFKVWTQNNTAQTVFDGVFALFVFYFIIKFFREWRTEFKLTRRPFSFILKIWNMLEAINLFILVLALGFRVAWILDSVAANVQLYDLIHGDYPVDLEGILWKFSFVTYLNGINNLLTYIKFLKYVRLNDRLNILTRTMEVCQRNIAGSLFLFLYLMAAFALAGQALFGNALHDWRNVNTAFSTVMRMLVGDFDYPAMREENRFATSIYFWLVITVGLYLMLSAIIIAIVSEGFAQVSVTQNNVPLDIAIGRMLTKLRKKTWKPKGSQRSQSVLLAIMYRMMHAEYMQRLMTIPQDLQGHIDDTDITFAFTDLSKLVPADVIKELGDEKVADIWEDIDYQWRLYLKNDHQMQTKHSAARLSRTMSGILDNETEIIQGVSAKVQDLQVQVTEMMDTLEHKHGSH